jgi:hypothetical protein
MDARQGGQAYSIEFSDEAQTLFLTIDGFWTPLIAARFSSEIIQVVKTISVTHRFFHTLLDQRGFKVQSADTVLRLNETFAITGRMHTGRLAVVTSSSLAKLQVERNVADPRARVFSDLESAKAWLAAAASPD